MIKASYRQLDMFQYISELTPGLQHLAGPESFLLSLWCLCFSVYKSTLKQRTFFGEGTLPPQ